MVGRSNDTAGRPTRRSGVVPLLAIVVACGVTGSTVFFGMVPKSGAAPVPVFKAVPGSPEEIVRLYNELAHANATRRERAYERLLEIGPPALLRDLPAGCLHHWWPMEVVPPARKIARNPRGIGDPNRTRLTFRLIEEIQKKHGPQAIQLNELAFTPFGDRVWKIPPPGGETKIDLGVEVTNVGKTPVRFHLGALCSSALVDPTALWVKSGIARMGMGPSRSFTPLLRPGESRRVTMPLAKLCRGRNSEAVWLDVRHGDGITSAYQGLKPGRYYLSHCCYHGPRYVLGSEELQPPLYPPDGSPCWSGKVDTVYVPIDIE